jgi:hypothetical protein
VGGSGRPLGFWVKALQGEEAVGGGNECGVVVPAEPGAALVVVEAELALELFVVQLDLPAQPREPGELPGLGGSGQVGQPVVGRLLGALWPFGDQPFLAGRDLLRVGPVGCIYSIGRRLGGGRVLVDEAAEPIVPADRGRRRARLGRRWMSWFGRGEFERSVRPMPVVVVDELAENML